ncbi:4847_t:CDS:2 [Cetraspora pellucida]|uniref:Small ribosomal subunit protein mS38 n=1 Tax=Cetraspora pellucida TaxID=1433469 RepID=A0A9N8VWP9_9GLOM|nr:4847_t:CDS:2 [Cetraspora pellucida]
MESAMSLFRQRVLTNYNLNNFVKYVVSATRLYSSNNTKRAAISATPPKQELPFVHVNHIHPRDLAQSTFFALHRPLLTFGSEQPAMDNVQQQHEEEEYEEDTSNAPNPMSLSNPLSPYLTSSPFHPTQPAISITPTESLMIVNRFLTDQKSKVEKDEQMISNNNTLDRSQEQFIEDKEMKRRKHKLYLTNIVQKRRLKMNKHKHKKLRKRLRALRKRLGK